MKIKEILNYIAGFLLGGIITVQFIKEFNSDDVMSWLFLIPIVGYDVLLLIHLIMRIRAENDDD